MKKFQIIKFPESFVLTLRRFFVGIGRRQADWRISTMDDESTESAEIARRSWQTSSNSNALRAKKW